MASEHETARNPDGKTCHECVHIKRCRMLGVIETGGHDADSGDCDWIPSRFRAALTQGAGEPGGER